jgi:hypothetical protein
MTYAGMSLADLLEPDPCTACGKMVGYVITGVSKWPGPDPDSKFTVARKGHVCLEDI